MASILQDEHHYSARDLEELANHLLKNFRSYPQTGTQTDSITNSVEVQAITRTCWNYCILYADDDACDSNLNTVVERSYQPIIKTKNYSGSFVSKKRYEVFSRKEYRYVIWQQNSLFSKRKILFGVMCYVLEILLSAGGEIIHLL